MEEKSGSLGQRTLSPPDSSLDDLELENCIEEFDHLGDLDSSELTRKPHFLDYDNKPPAELVVQHNRLNGTSPSVEGEQINAALAYEPNFTQNGKPSTVVPGSVASAVQLADVAYETPLSILPKLSPSMKKFSTSAGSRGTWPLKERINPVRRQQHHSLKRELTEVGPKMECVYSLLSMLGSTNVLEMSTKFLELSRNEEKCSALRRSGCVPLLVHIIHNEPNEVARKNARLALVNVICCNADETSARREQKVLRLIDQLIDYTDVLKEQHSAGGGSAAESAAERQTPPDQERHPIQAIGTLAKISYDEDHRHAMCQFGALQTISSLIQLDHLVHGVAPDVLKCIEMRRYASMVLTNLTFGQGNSKAQLCSNRDFMQALVSQLSCTELVQVTASVLRNLSWRADSLTKQTLIEIDTVKILTESAMRCIVENTLKSILSALWNLSNHCAQNRAKICEVDGALEFLIDMLTYDASSKTMSIVENAGGILRNISSHIAQCGQYRQILRDKNCLKILLDQLKSPSLTVVSNACGTLGNISSDNSEDQQFLRENGAIPMLRSLIYSKHNIISSGSRLALKNLQQRPPDETSLLAQSGEHQAKGMGKSAEAKDLPSLNMRKQRAIEHELGSGFYQNKPIDPTKEDTSGEERITQCRNSAVDSTAVPRVLAKDQLGLETEQPINYCLQDDLQEQQHLSSYDYQETDIDQLTDYSLRYAENQSDSDDDKDEAYHADPENVLIPEDSVKCYYTEGTPQIISSATSLSDLRASAAPQPHTQPSPFKQVNALKSSPIPIGTDSPLVVPDELGCNTPDKPFNYCEEGTPDFSRDASLNIINLTDERKRSASERKGEPTATVDMLAGVPGQVVVELPGGPVVKSVSFMNTAEETPLMFSRTSSMGSLSSAEPACTDDKSSIVSEFSRMASGVISPSDLPDSPTQTAAHSPRHSGGGSMPSTSPFDFRAQMNGEHRPVLQQQPQQDQKEEEEEGEGAERERPACVIARPQSAFEDTVNKFDVENTPAQFSCATSLSNLSIEEKEADESMQKLEFVGENADGQRSSSPVLPNPAELITANESIMSDGDSDAGGDDELLASCISIGMNSGKARSSMKDELNGGPTYANIPAGKALPMSTTEPLGQLSCGEMLQRYCTDSAAARQLSGAQSLGNLSALTIDTGRDGPDSDDSSNESDNDWLLEECILSGMPKPKNAIDIEKQLTHQPLQTIGSVEKESPIKMMRNPVHLQPLLANDELSSFHVEDSPCNFSTVSALSELTVASEPGSSQKPQGRMERDNLEGMSKRNDAAAAANQLLDSPSVASVDDDTTDAIRKAKEKVQYRHGNMPGHVSPTDGIRHADGKRLNSIGVNSADSTETANTDDEQHEALLQDAIERGMKKLAGGSAARQEAELCLSAATGKSVESTLDSDPDDDDYQLLAECIQRGMHTVPKGQPGPRVDRELELAGSLQRLKIGAGSAGSSMQMGIPKNVHTTPVIPKDVGAAEVSAGVVSSASYQPQSTGTRASPSRVMYPYQASIAATTDITTVRPRGRSTTADGPGLYGRTTPEGGPAPPEVAKVSVNGCDRERPEGGCSFASNSGARIRCCCPKGCTKPTKTYREQLSVVEPLDEVIGDCVPVAVPTTDKQKDPGLMLKSVERFTRELVSQSDKGANVHSEDAISVVSKPEPQIKFELGGEVSVFSFSLSVDESRNIAEFENLPDMEPPSMLSDQDLFSTSIPTPPPRAPFLPQFSSVIRMANINSMEPPSLLNESLDSLPTTKWADGSNTEGADSPPMIISMKTYFPTPPSAGDTDDAPADCTASTDELSQPQSIQQAVNACITRTNSPSTVELLPPPSLGNGKQDAPAAPVKSGNATKTSPKDQQQQRRVLTKLPQQRKPVPSAAPNSRAAVCAIKTTSYVSPYGRANGSTATARQNGASHAVRGATEHGAGTTTKIPSSPVAKSAKGSAGGKTRSGGMNDTSKQAKGSSNRIAASSVPVTLGVHSPPTASKASGAASNHPTKQSKASAKHNSAPSPNVVQSSNITGTTPDQPKGSPKRRLATTVCVTSSLQPAPSVTKPTVLTRQQTFVNEKPTMAALPHISSAVSSPAKVQKASAGYGAKTGADLLTRANTTLQKRFPSSGDVIAFSPTPRVSRIPPPPSRLKGTAAMSGGRMGTRKEAHTSFPTGRDSLQHSH